MGRKDPLEEGMATLFSILARKIPWTEELATYSLQSRKESDMTGETALKRARAPGSQGCFSMAVFHKHTLQLLSISVFS